MENKIMNFKNEEFGQVRTITKENEIWFVGKDVAECLGYTRATKAIRDRVDKEDIGEVPIQDSIGRMQNTPIINESGLYSLVLGSKLSQAKKFKRWVTSDVLPSIRKHGMYAKDELLDNPDLLIEVATELKKEREARKIAENKVQTFLDTENYLEWNTVAKNLEIGRNIMLRKLREKQILQTDEFQIKGQKCTGEKHNIPYQKYMKYFKVKHVIKNDKRFPKVVVTADGQEFLRKILNR